jgi:hypothetical protein
MIRYVVGFRYLMLQVLHWGVLYCWLLHSITSWIIFDVVVCLCGGTFESCIMCGHFLTTDCPSMLFWLPHLLCSYFAIDSSVYLLLPVFVLCWCPYFVFNMLELYVLPHGPDRSKLQANMSIVLQCLAPLNSAANPIIYGIFSTRICRNLRWVPSSSISGECKVL